LVLLVLHILAETTTIFRELQMLNEQYYHSLLTKSEIFTLLKSGDKSLVTRCLDTTFYSILIFHLCFNFNSVLIILYLWLTLICKHFPFVIYNHYYMLYMSSTFLAPWRCLLFSAETCWSNKTNRAFRWSETCLYYFGP
jgi:hypothetical protein